MYVDQITISGVKLLRDLDLSFLNEDGSRRMWTVFVGDNGLCKTTLLQSIALVAAGTVRSNQLANVPSFPDRRPGAAAAEITGTFRVGTALDGDAGTVLKGPTSRVSSTLSVEPPAQVFSGSSRYVSPGLTNLPDPVSHQQTRAGAGWFVLGYGVGRWLPEPGRTESQEQLTLARLAPLFKSDAAIIATGFADILGAKLARTFASLLGQALVKSGLLPRTTALELRGRGGASSAASLLESHRFEMQFGDTKVRLPGVWLSQGYQAMIAWVADLIGHALSHAQRRVELDEIAGLVLIDELDLFVHPRWQVQLVRTLRTVFPKVQFVATTHSPMVLAGLRQEELFILTQDETGNVRAEPAETPPQLMTGSELYAAFFGVAETHPSELRERLRDYALLANNPYRSQAEDRQVVALRRRLMDEGIEVGFEPVPRQAA
jgi:hypothetical protein